MWKVVWGREERENEVRRACVVRNSEREGGRDYDD